MNACYYPMSWAHIRSPNSVSQNKVSIWHKGHPWAGEGGSYQDTQCWLCPSKGAGLGPSLLGPVRGWQALPWGREGGGLAVGQGPAPTHPGLGPDPGQQLGLVICIQDHKGHEGAVDVPPVGLRLLAVGLHGHAHLHAEGREGCSHAAQTFPRPCPLSSTCTHTYARLHTPAVPPAVDQSPTGRKLGAVPFP